MQFADHRCTRCGRVWLSHQTVRGSCPRCGGTLQPDTNGKTPRQEAEDSTRALGCAMIYAAIVVLLIIAFFLYL